MTAILAWLLLILEWDGVEQKVTVLPVNKSQCDEMMQEIMPATPYSGIYCFGPAGQVMRQLEDGTVAIETRTKK